MNLVERIRELPYSQDGDIRQVTHDLLMDILDLDYNKQNDIIDHFIFNARLKLSKPIYSLLTMDLKLFYSKDISPYSFCRLLGYRQIESLKEYDELSVTIFLQEPPLHDPRFFDHPNIPNTIKALIGLKFQRIMMGRQVIIVENKEDILFPKAKKYSKDYPMIPVLKFHYKKKKDSSVYEYSLLLVEPKISVIDNSPFTANQDIILREIESKFDASIIHYETIFEMYEEMKENEKFAEALKLTQSVMLRFRDYYESVLSWVKTLSPEPLTQSDLIDYRTNPMFDPDKIMIILSKSGHGFKRIFSMLFTLIYKKPNFLVIKNFENGIHRTILEHLAEMIRNFETTTIIGTYCEEEYNDVCKYGLMFYVNDDSELKMELEK